MKMRETSRGKDKEPCVNNKVFLNKDRVSMPDVDSDFSPDIRDLVVEYCKKLYSVETVANIASKGYMAPRGAIRNVARVIGVEKDNRTYYLNLADKIAKLVPMEPGMCFRLCEDELRKAFEIKEGDSEDVISYKNDSNEIIDQAVLVENTFLNYGMHAAGVIIADGNPISDYVPLMRDDKSGDMKVQCDMVQAEELHGLLKFDFLGLRNLKIVTLTLRSIKKRFGIDLDVEHLPADPNVYKYIFSTGNTGSVFQFESGGMKKMLKNAKPDCFEDIVALVSLYRPGPMEFIPKYIDAKFHPEHITYLCPELEPILNKTYGCIVYQEQVMEIVQKLAGFSLSQADNVRRYMSKKKMDKLEYERDAFIYGDEERGIVGCVKNGIKKEAAEEIFDQMVEFAKYAFNKSHAAAYAALSYITAYLKYHYPADYMCSVLNCTDNIKKMPSVLNDCREINVKVLPPEINKSGIGFTVDGDAIRFGMNSIKGTKLASILKIMEDRETNGNYVSFKDFLKRRVADKSTTENLIKSGAMDEFNDSRSALLNNYAVSVDVIEKIWKKKGIISELEESETNDEKALKKLKKAKDELIVLNKQFEVIRISYVPESFKERLKEEKEVLGFFISAHPMDAYDFPTNRTCTPIEELEVGKKPVRIMGMIENLVIRRKKDTGEPMAFFDLEDQTGTIHVCCFTEAYSNYGESLEEDSVYQLTGTVRENSMSKSADSEDEEEEEVQLEFFMAELKEIHPNLKDIRISWNIVDWAELLSNLRELGYIEEEGHPLMIHDTLMGELRKTEFYISEKILTDTAFETELDL